jgi:hypothetical protein
VIGQVFELPAIGFPWYVLMRSFGDAIKHGRTPQVVVKHYDHPQDALRCVDVVTLLPDGRLEFRRTVTPRAYAPRVTIPITLATKP